MPAGDHGEDVTIYVGDSGEKYSDPADWRELISEQRLTALKVVPVRRGGALSHARAIDIPELKALFDQLAPEPAAPRSAPEPPPLPSSPKPRPAPASAVQLQQGANASVQHARVAVTIGWNATAGAVEVDPSAYLLNSAGRVRGDGDMVFFNQLAAEDGAVRVLLSESDGAASYEVDLDRLPEAVGKVVFCLSIAEAAEEGRTFAQLAPTSIEIGALSGPASVRYDLKLDGAPEAAMILGELYRRHGGWRFRAVGQGFHGGLAPLARSFGVEVED